MNSSGNKIKVILVTGFLGSGKTTLINRLIEYYRSKKIALIINDFGIISVDGILLKERMDENLNSKIYEIANGSIFCSCLSSELVKVLRLFVDHNPEILLIETSGLSDPSTFLKILIDNNLSNNYNIENSICVVDSTTVVKLYGTITAIEKQLRSSSIVLINKSDLIKDDEFRKIKELVIKNNDTALILKTKHADLDMSILHENQNKEILSDFISCNSVSNRPGSLQLEQKELSLDDIENYFNSIKNHILRFKGFLKIGEYSYYISDSNGKLKIERINKIKIANYGLSVLFPKEYEASIKINWEMI